MFRTDFGVAASTAPRGRAGSRERPARDRPIKSQAEQYMSLTACHLPT
jgi:hypothetical protein